jgi:thiol:disulfide interchange protein
LPWSRSKSCANGLAAAPSETTRRPARKEQGRLIPSPAAKIHPGFQHQTFNDDNETRKPKPNQSSEPAQSSQTVSQLGIWAFGFGAIAVLPCILPVRLRRSQKPS